MKINFKKKIMLAVLAGGMLYANGAFASSDYWNGTTGNKWSPNSGDAVASGLVLTIDADTKDIEGNSCSVVSCFYGGRGHNESVSYNKITINSGTFDGTVFHAGFVTGANANYNTLIVNGGTFVNGYQIAGYTDRSAKGNSIIINDGTSFSGSFMIVAGTSAGDLLADGNMVTINGGTFGSGVMIWGGLTEGTSTNNTLNVKTKMNGKVADINYFQKMNFTLPADIAGGDTMLETASVTYDDTIIGVDAANGVKLSSGDVITLIAADNKIGDVSNINETVLGGAGVISMDDKYLILTMLQDFEQKAAAGGGDKEKAPVEGIAASVAMVNQSADLASGEGMASLQKETVDGFTNTYGAITAGRSKYQTGSHVDMDGWGVLIGAGTSKNWTSGDKTTYGLFFEYGKGDFDTYNNDIHGEGDSKNEGVGIMARHTLKNNTYFDANIRYGKQETEWSESEIGGYDTDSRYYGAAVGLGHIYSVGKNEIDIYGRYSFGHVGACDAKVKDSDYHFDRVLSQRIRLGAKYNFVQKNNKAKPYVGMAWERELKGESKATITGIGEAPAPSLKGNTGIFEIGCDWDTGKWSLGAGANAYIGKRKGWGGMFNAFYNF